MKQSKTKTATRKFVNLVEMVRNKPRYHPYGNTSGWNLHINSSDSISKWRRRPIPNRRRLPTTQNVHEYRLIGTRAGCGCSSVLTQPRTYSRISVGVGGSNEEDISSNSESGVAKVDTSTIIPTPQQALMTVSPDARECPATSAFPLRNSITESSSKTTEELDDQAQTDDDGNQAAENDSVGFIKESSSEDDGEEMVDSFSVAEVNEESSSDNTLADSRSTLNMVPEADVLNSDEQQADDKAGGDGPHNNSVIEIEITLTGNDTNSDDEDGEEREEDEEEHEYNAAVDEENY